MKTKILFYEGNMELIFALILLLIIVILFLLVAFVLLSVITLPLLMKPNKKRDVEYFKRKLYAHRGLHDETIPENSLKAFEEARKNGYGVELDVQMTKDGKLVVFHDGNLQRMCGIDAKLKDFTYEELSKLRLKDTNEVIPLFEQVLGILGNTDLICEIKGDNGVKNYEICEKTYDMLRSYEGTYCIESFSPFLVKWFRTFHPEIIRGQLSQKFGKEDNMKFPVRFFMNSLAVNFVSKPDFIAFRHQDVGTLGFRMVTALYDPFVVAWTARGEEEQKHAWEHFDSVIFEKGNGK